MKGPCGADPCDLRVVAMRVKNQNENLQNGGNLPPKYYYFSQLEKISQEKENPQQKQLKREKKQRKEGRLGKGSEIENQVR